MMNRKLTTILGLAGLLATTGALAAMGPLDKVKKAGQHAAQAAQKAAVGQKAPNFKLEDTDGNMHELARLTEAGHVVVLEWFNAECPFVKAHYRESTNTMNTLASEFKKDGVVWLRINSAGERHPTTGVEFNNKARERWNIQGPVLLDYSGAVGKGYGAKTTPHMYVIDSAGVLQYAGAIDGKMTGKEDTNYVRDALRAVMAGETVEVAETKPYGCSVKYKK